MKKIYFIRHWETDRNLNWFINPWDVDSELNETWIKQAEIAWNNMKKDNTNFDLIISSSLIRAIKTAKIIAEKIWYKKEIILEKNLKEKFAGVFKNYLKKDFQKEFWVRIVEEILQKYPDKNFEWTEKMEDFEKRIKNIYEKIKNNKEYKNKKILIVAHWWVAQVLLNIKHIWNCELVKIV